jgi:tetratricopeptide (TPR) repeat protein
VDTLRSVNNLAGLLKDQGKWHEAEPLLRRVLRGRESTLGAEHVDTLSSVSNLALVLKAQGRFGEAEPLYRRALAGREPKLGSRHRDTLRSMTNLSGLLEAQGKLPESERYYRRALDGLDATLGVNHQSSLVTCSNYAWVLADLERYDEALPLFFRCADAWSTKTTFEPLWVRFGVALCEGVAADSLGEAEEALRAFAEFVGPDHPRVAKARGRLDAARKRSS